MLEIMGNRSVGINWPTYDIGKIKFDGIKFEDLSVHQSCRKNSKLYRFMSYDRFESLLHEGKGQLFFATAKTLSDKFEGGFLIPRLENICLENRECTYVSCWTENNPQNESSLFMWKPHYLSKDHIKCDNHIAIGISIEKFLLTRSDSYLFQDKRFEKYMGIINYIKPEYDYPPTYKANTLAPFFLKRIYFTDEKEIRIIIQDMKPNDPSYSFKSYQILDGKPVSGIPVPIDLEQIDEFIVSPIAEDDIVNKINRLISEAGLNKKPKKFRMASDKALKEASEKVKCLNSYNEEPLPSSEYYNRYELEEQEYVSLENVVVVDASGNVILREPSKRSIKTIQQSQSYNTNDTIIKEVRFNRITFVCHRSTNKYLMHLLK